MGEGLGIYVSVPFCRAKCTYCNFASGVFGAERVDPYLERLSAEIALTRQDATELGGRMPELVDTVYFGGGTPSLLEPGQVRRVFNALRGEFALDPAAEVTLECAPGQLAPETLEELQRQGLNRISFGVQSFSDGESRAVGRTHTRSACLEEIERVRAMGVSNVNVDLIVGLPHQTRASWFESLGTAVASGAPHVSVYMLEVDEDSRLGREVLSAGARYGAGALPSEDQIADWYAEGCEVLEAEGIRQYEISNFAREGSQSRHNLKYWRREPYIGFGLDAHSMMHTKHGAVRWANTDDLDRYVATPNHQTQGTPHSALRVLPATVAEFRSVDRIGTVAAFEEAVFLGLRLNEGIDLDLLSRSFCDALVCQLLQQLAEPEQAGLLIRAGKHLRLTPRGRMVSNEVFGRVLIPAEPIEV